MSGVIKGLFFAVLWALVSVAVAETESEEPVVVAHATMRGQDVPVYRIGEVQADDTPAGMDGFAIRVAYVLRAWTEKNKVEAVANFCRSADGKRWGAVLLTIYSHKSSPHTNACPENMAAVGVDEHSHPQHQTYKPNAVDRLFLVNPYVDRVVTLPDTFSPADYEHAGYMVGARALHYQDGPAHERVVWRMSQPEPTL
ncbi:MAG: hypothetical protein WA930_14995 [Rhodanobacter sp.]